MKVYTKDGQPVEPGDRVTSFRGEEHLLVQATRANSDGHDGKVVVVPVGQALHARREYYANVFGLTVKNE